MAKLTSEKEKLTVIKLPFSPDEKTKKGFEDVVEKLGGNKNQIKYLVDETVLGGFELRVNDYIYDSTLKGELEALVKSVI